MNRAFTVLGKLPNAQILYIARRKISAHRYRPLVRKRAANGFPPVKRAPERLKMVLICGMWLLLAFTVNTCRETLAA
jgi:hypothetical protein